MKRLILFLIVVFLITGCAKDIILESQSDIRGNYEGTYQSIINYQIPSTKIKNQDVNWIFTDFRFICDADVDSTRVFCDFSGNYSMGDYLVFKDTLVEEQVCTHSDIPIGEFVFRREGDSLIITQWDQEAFTFKELRLLKITD